MIEYPLKKNKSASTSGTQKTGFFRSLFGKSDNNNPTSNVPQQSKPITRATSISAGHSGNKVVNPGKNKLTKVRSVSAVSTRKLHKTEPKGTSSGNNTTLHRTTSSGRYRNDDTKLSHKHNYVSDKDNKLPNEQDTNRDEEDEDRLVKFLQYYKSKNYAVSAFHDPKPLQHSDVNAKKDVKLNMNDNIPENAIADDDDFDSYDSDADSNADMDSIDSAVLVFRTDNKSSTDDGLNSNHEDKGTDWVDQKGRPIPAHPPTSKFPSILKNPIKDDNIIEDDISQQYEKSPSPQGDKLSSAKFGTFLKKVKSTNPQQQAQPSYYTLKKTKSNSSGIKSPNSNRRSSLTPECQLTSQNTTKDHDGKKHKYNSIDENVNEISSHHSKNKISNQRFSYSLIPGLEKIKPLGHVAFATNTYFNDPPQQICSKNPRKGEVEVTKDGSVIIHRLSPEERRKLLESSTFGIVVGGTGQLKLLGPDSENAVVSSKDSNPIHSKNDTGKTNKDEFTKQHGGDIDAREKNMDTAHLKIDKPMLSRRSTAATSNHSLVSLIRQDSSDSEVFPPPDLSLSHDVVYTRCCHLREILPIPAIMKQLKKGSTDPIPFLQLRNPRPSMVEVWSFADFISIVPILCISLDGVNLTAEQLRIILGSLIFKKKFEKLSLRNTQLDIEGWKILCYFISKTKSLTSLDLSMVPGIKTNAQKPPKSSSKKNPLKRMSSNVKCRDDVNWNLLTAALASKNGLEELIVSGARMDQEAFQNFIQVACIATERLGLAHSELTTSQCNKLGEWLVQSKVTGLDVSFNDLKGKIGAFADAIRSKVKNANEKNIFKYISLRGTNLSVEKGDRSENNETLRVLTFLCYCENMKFMDLSDNPGMFPYGIHTLIKVLPVFANLVRLHLDNENLSEACVIMLSEVIPLCSRLNYLSMLGTKFNIATSNALVDAIRKSSSLITLDIDEEDLSEKVKNDMSIYTMRNVENEFKKVEQSRNKGKDIKLTKKDKDSLGSFQQELSELLTDAFDDEEHYNQLAKQFIDQTTVSRLKIRKVIQDLFALRVNSQLNFEGKEALIRFCFIDACFEKGIRLIQERTLSRQQPSKTRPPLNVLSLSSNPFRDRSQTPSSMFQAVPSSSNILTSGHSALLPFGTGEPQDFDPNDDTEMKEYRNDQDYQTVQLRDTQSREEGNVFKQTMNVRKNIERASKEHNDIDTKALGIAAEKLDSDGIKQFLLKNDISSVVEVIDEIHKQGYHLHDIFKKREDEERDDSVEEPAPTLGSKLQAEEAELKKVFHSSNPFVDASDVLPQDKKGSDEDSYKSLDKSHRKQIDAAYDTVLDDLQQTRKANKMDEVITDH